MLVAFKNNQATFSVQVLINRPNKPKAGAAWKPLSYQYPSKIILAHQTIRK